MVPNFLYLFMFERKGLPNREKKDTLGRIKNWATMLGAVLCTSISFNATKANAQLPTINDSMLNKSVKAQIDTSTPLPEATPDQLQKIEALRSRLANISKKSVLSTPEITKKIHPTIDKHAGAVYSGTQTIDTKTDAYFLERKDSPYTDIVSKNETTELRAGVAKKSVTQTVDVPLTKGYMTVETFAALKGEDGQHRALLNQRSGYINSDGSKNSVRTIGQSETNARDESNYQRGDVIDPSIIEEFKRPGSQSRDFYNQNGYVAQAKTYELAGEPKIQLDHKTTPSLSISKSRTLKHTSSSASSTTVRESVRAHSLDSSTSAESQALINLAALTPSPLESVVKKAQNQSGLRQSSGEGPVKKAVVHSPKALQALHNLENLSNSGINPAVKESRLKVERNKSTGAFERFDVGYEPTIRRTTEVFDPTEINHSDYTSVFRSGAETDSNKNLDVTVDGQTRGKEAVVGMHFGIDNKTSTLRSRSVQTTHNQPEATAGLSAGVKEGDVLIAGRGAVNYDQLSDKVYPSARGVVQIKKPNAGLQVSGHYSTNPSIDRPNEASITTTVAAPVSKKVALSAHGSHRVDLGGNDANYKTRTTIGGAASLGTSIRTSGELYVGNGETSDKGYALQAVLTKNWGTIYANISKVNSTQSYGGGVTTKIGKNTSAGIEYKKFDTSGSLFDDSTVKFTLRRSR